MHSKGFLVAAGFNLLFVYGWHIALLVTGRALKFPTPEAELIAMAMALGPIWVAIFFCRNANWKDAFLLTIGGGLVLTAAYLDRLKPDLDFLGLLVLLLVVGGTLVTTCSTSQAKWYSLPAQRPC